ncbi:MAG: hypothetical protein OQK04_01430, partial [Kangiellaceae bacterium]|nr:hypothetical protein [Kangiellaceae bacterium]
INYNQVFSVPVFPHKSQHQKTQSKNESPFHTRSQFQILIGETDVSSLFRWQDNHLSFAGDAPLPSGENELTVNQLVNNNWTTVGSIPVQILTSGGFKQASWTPRLEVGLNSQLDERTSGDAVESERPTFTDITASIGLTSHHENNNLELNSNINLLAVSNREQAVRFAQENQNASKLDLADYQVSMKRSNHRLILGHTNFGNNPLLIDGLSRRGLSWQFASESNVTFNGALLSGTDIVGFDNFTGLADHDEQFVNAFGFGFTTFADSRISLRVEGTFLDAERKPIGNLGIGEIASAEKSRGIGLKFTASDQENLLSSELIIGLSHYSNPQDESLSFGDELVELETSSALAYNFNLSYVLLKQWQTPWHTPFSLTINASKNKAEPFYQTLAAFVQANVESELVGGQYKLGKLSGNFSTQLAQDNLDNIVSLLTTRTENDSFTSSFPLAEILNESEEEFSSSSWLPTLDYNYQSTHQYALNSPLEEISGFNGTSHLPDQVTRIHTLISNWQIKQHSFALQSSESTQDNRQIGRENADFDNQQHTLSLNVQQDESTSWSFSLGRNRQKDIEANKVQFSKSVTLSYNWQSDTGLAISANYGLTKDDDSLGEAENNSTNADIGLVKNLVKGEWWFPADGSFSLRVNYNDSKSIDRVFDQRSQFGNTIVQMGINLSFQ